jgi:hypothetical protein
MSPQSPRRIITSEADDEELAMTPMNADPMLMFVYLRHAEILGAAERRRTVGDLRRARQRSAVRLGWRRARGERAR